MRVCRNWQLAVWIYDEMVWPESPKTGCCSVAILVLGVLKTLCAAAIGYRELANEPAINSPILTVLKGVLLPIKAKGGFRNGSNKRTKRTEDECRGSPSL